MQERGGLGGYLVSEVLDDILCTVICMERVPVVDQKAGAAPAILHPMALTTSTLEVSLLEGGGSLMGGAGATGMRSLSACSRFGNGWTGAGAWAGTSCGRNLPLRSMAPTVFPFLGC